VFCLKGQNVPKISGTFCSFCQKIWDGLSVPKGYFVLGTFCPKDRSVAGAFQPGTLRPGTFRPVTFRQGTAQGEDLKTTHEAQKYMYDGPVYMLGSRIPVRLDPNLFVQIRIHERALAVHRQLDSKLLQNPPDLRTLILRIYTDALQVLYGP
jgi:hypothetical protein